MIGNIELTTLETTPEDTASVEKFHFDTGIAQQLSRAAEALQRLSELESMTYAERHTVNAPTLVGELAAFASATSALHSYGVLGQRVLMKLVSGKELSDGEAVFLQQIQHAATPGDTQPE